MTIANEIASCGEFLVELVHDMTVEAGLEQLVKGYSGFEDFKYAGGDDQSEFDRSRYEQRPGFFRPVRNASNAFWTVVRPVTTVLTLASIEAILALLTPLIVAAGIISLVIALLSAPFDTDFAKNSWEFFTGSAASTFVSLVSMASLALAIVISPISDLIALVTRTAATVIDAVDDCVNQESSSSSSYSY